VGLVGTHHRGQSYQALADDTGHDRDSLDKGSGGRDVTTLRANVLAVWRNMDQLESTKLDFLLMDPLMGDDPIETTTPINPL
ncbi:hypothetical protein HAX54_030185, partial [Datura stramonium]|nr:hypothetical protein [Datura stramonium]